MAIPRSTEVTPDTVAKLYLALSYVFAVFTCPWRLIHRVISLLSRQYALALCNHNTDALTAYPPESRHPWLDTAKYKACICNTEADKAG